MSKIWEWIRSHRFSTIIIILAALILPPLIVHLLFKIEAPFPFLEHTWGAGDIITYIAGFEAFLGSLFLGIVAIQKAEQANEISERVINSEITREKKARTPSIMVQHVQIQSILISEMVSKNMLLYTDEFTCDPRISNCESAHCFEISLVNASFSGVDFQLSSTTIHSFPDRSIKLRYCSLPLGPNKTPSFLIPNSIITIYLILPENVIQESFSWFFQIVLEMRNTYQERYIEAISFRSSGIKESTFTIQKPIYEIFQED